MGYLTQPMVVVYYIEWRCACLRTYPNTRAPNCPFLCSSLTYFFLDRRDNNNISKTRNRPNNTTITVQCSISIGIYTVIYYTISYA